MPCLNCRHWTPGNPATPRIQKDPASYGVCEHVAPTERHNPPMFQYAYKSLFTRSDFGCSEFWEKEPK